MDELPDLLRRAAAAAADYRASLPERPVAPPVDPSALRRAFGGGTELFTIADLGGWTEVRTRFFDREGSIFLDIENELGVPTDD